MRFVTARERKRTLDIEVTPMIDVVFLLIIFFMTTAQFARMTRAELALPLELGEQEAAPQEAGLVINITREGEIIVSDRSFDLAGLEQLVREGIQLHPDSPPQQLKLLIRADRNAESASLNQVVRLLQSLDVGSARLATEVPR